MFQRMARIAPYAIFAWLALALLPVLPDPIITGVDASWQYGINLAHAHGLRAGSEVIHSVGPLAYLCYPDANYAGAAPVLAFLALNYVLFFYAVTRVAWVGGPVAGATAGSIAGVLMIYHLQPLDTWFAVTALCLVVVSLARERFPLADVAVAGSACALSSLIKLSDGGVLTLLLAVTLVRWRRTSVLQIVAALLIPAAVFLAAAGNTDLIPYIAGSLRIAGAYSVVMGTPGPFWQLALAALSAAAIVYLALRERVLLAAALTAILCFAVFKHGMVRQDGHAAVTQSKLAVASLFVLCATCGRPHWRRWASAAVASSLLSIAIVHADPTAHSAAMDRRALLLSLPEMARDLSHWGQAWQGLAARNREIVKPLLLDGAIPATIGNAPVDAYPNNIETVRAHGWNYSPRPVLQSMLAYTPQLDAINARHLAGNHAARFIVLQPGTIDGHHIAFEDPLSWRALLNHYEVRAKSDKALLLERSPRAERFLPAEFLFETNTSWRREVDMPQVEQHQALMMRVKIRPSPLGRLMNALVRSAPVYFQLSRKTEGHQSFGRVVVPQLDSGIFVDPLPRDLDEIADWFGTPTSAERATRIMFWNDGFLEYEPDVRIAWYRVRPAPTGR